MEIESYVRLFSVPDKERFAILILASDTAVWDAKEKAAEQQAARDRLKKLKGR